MNYNLQKIWDEIVDTNVYLMMKEPFFAHFFSGLLKDINEKIPTGCIAHESESNYLSLWVNPKFWSESLKGINNNETRNYRYGFIKHEILHIVFGHIFRYKEFSNKKLYNIAADIVVNQEINSNELIESACTIDLFPDFNLKERQSLDYYYNALNKEKDKMESLFNQNSDNGSGDSNDSNSGSENESGEGENKNGHGEKGSPNKSQENLKRLLEEPDNHKTWKEIIDKLGENQHLVEDKIKKQVKEITEKLKGSNQWGDMPGFLKNFIEQTLKKKKKVINWKNIFRRFAASSSSTYVKNTIKRTSRRYGTNPGSKIKKRQKILVAIDTSGSVDNESLSEFFSEIYYIWKTGAQVRIVECDTIINKDWDYKGIAPNNITGRGGTDFNAPFEYANTYRPDALIYFTDGYCTPPKVKTRVKKQMWIICKNGGKDLNSFKQQGYKGICIKMH